MSYMDVKPGHVDAHNMVLDSAFKRSDDLLDQLNVVMNQADAASMNSGSEEWKALQLRWKSIYADQQAKLAGIGMSSHGALNAIRGGDRGAAAAMGGS